MADAGLNPMAWTDPRMMLAQQLIQGSADASPVRSWTQELARALQGPVGAYMATKVRDDRNQALTDIYNPSGGSQPQQPQSSPGLFERIGNFLGGGQSAPNATSGQPSAAPSPQIAAGGSPGSSGPQPQGGQPQPQQATNAGDGSAPPAPSATPPGTPQGGFARQIYMAQRMMQVGRERNMPDLVQQGAQMLFGIQQKQAETQLEAAKDGRNMNIGPDGSISISPIAGYDTTMAGTEAAKTRASELAKLDPSITQGRITQTNATNIGTMGSTAQFEGAKAAAEAGARNASDLAYAGRLTTARGQAAADVALKNQPVLEATKTAAINAVNAGKPLTPQERNDQEQKVGEQFRNSETAKEYFQTAQGYKNVMAAAQATDKASDINLIDGLVKMFNPGATVRQGSFDTFMEHSQGLPDNVVGLVKSYFGNGQHLAPETRAQLLDQAKNRMDSSRVNYKQQADSLGAQVKAQGLDPKNVIPAYVDPLTAFEELQRRRAAAAQQQAPAP